MPTYSEAFKVSERRLGVRLIADYP